MLFVYLAVLDIAWDKLSGGYLIGVAFDIPLIVAALSAILIRNTPLAMLITIASVIVCANVWDLTQFYRLHAPISQSFICLILSRLVAMLRKRNASELVKSNTWIYSRLSIASIEWNWTERADTLVNKSTRVFDALTLAFLALSALASIEVAVVGYTVLWLGFFALYVSPLLLCERVGRLFFSWRRSDGVDDLKVKTKDIALRSKNKITEKTGEAKSWIKSGFESE
jgi:hypothetical protein